MACNQIKVLVVKIPKTVGKLSCPIVVLKKLLRISRASSGPNNLFVCNFLIHVVILVRARLPPAGLHASRSERLATYMVYSIWYTSIESNF